MQHSISVSLIISTYNSPTYLELVLQSVMAQELLPQEVIIADDGSASDTLVLVERYQQSFPVPLVHVWHEDDGYRLSAIKNKAAAKATGSYIIFLDGDLVLHPFFIYDYQQSIRPDEILVASRVFLNEKYTRQLLQNRFTPVRYNFFKAEKNHLSGIRLPWLQHVVKGSTTHEGARGGLMGVFRQHFIRVNGFDESFTGWGREDSDLYVRLLNSGVKRRNIKFAAITYHLWHPVLSRQSLSTNDALLEKSIADKSVWCTKGISQYLPVAATT
ncbi:MAG TPA: glycosyltransferase family 2 protein [Ferruginibacter sp.]|nr:glycosyltransferase family 2 protein [Ferruginibacter sp.]HMP19350.1 glycosyltransferase family 2 protein [Ferruginibacter sp.]